MAQHPKVEYIRMYTDGSAARKLEIAAPVKKAKAPRTRKQKKILVYVDPVALAGIAVAVIMLVIMAASVVNLYTIQQETVALENYVTALRTENAQLLTEYESNIDLNRIEQTALSLGMVPREEVRHVTLKLESPAKQDAPNVWEQVRTFLTGLFA